MQPWPQGSIKPSCTHSNNSPVCQRWGALPRRCGQRRRNPGLGEGAVYQHAADCRWLCVGILFLLFTRSAQQQYARTTQPTTLSVQDVLDGEGSILVLPAANPKGPPETCDSLTLAPPCLRCCSTLCADQQHVLCEKQG